MGNLIEGLAPDQLALFVSLFAVAISDGLTADEIVMLGSFLAVLGDTVALIGEQMLFHEGKAENTGVPPGGG